jgi:hypothetical protein
MPLSGYHIIELTKITDYLLSETHPVGSAKAAFFKAFGFDRTDPVQFATQWKRMRGPGQSQR